MQWGKSMTRLSDGTAPAVLGLNRQTGRLWLNIVLVILLAATILSLIGDADGIHCVAGIFLLIGCGVHLALQVRWIKVVILNTPKNITPALRSQRRRFWATLLSGILCGLSGLGTLLLADPPFHIFLPLLCCGIPIHTLSGLTFLGLNIYHLVLHRNWFLTRIGRGSAAARG
jgi:hypothetical protein